MKPQINKRLLACASLVRREAVLGDIGTDHGYLPIYLLREGKISRAVLSDINEGPLSKARLNVALSGLSEKVTFRLCDGARELSELGITDYCIAGMGGELICDIVSSASALFSEDIRLILQPMSKPEALRAYLFDSGFSIEKEVYTFDEGKYYVCLLAKYEGRRAEYSAADAHFGTRECFEAARSPDMDGYMKIKQATLLRVIKGKKLGGKDASREIELFDKLNERLGILK